MKKKRRQEEERYAESKGRQGTVDFLSTSLWMCSKSAILVSNSLSFSCTVLSSVLALTPSIWLSLMSSKCCLPRSAAFITKRNKHKEWWGRNDEGENQNIQIFLFRLFLLFVLDPLRILLFSKTKCFLFQKTVASISSHPVCQEKFVKIVKYKCVTVL